MRNEHIADAYAKDGNNSGEARFLRNGSAYELGNAISDSVSAFGSVKTHNMDKDKKIPYNLKVLIVLCPFYSKSALGDSELVKGMQSIQDMQESRVAKKFRVYMKAIESAAEMLNGLGKSLELKVLFADTGVLLNHAYGDMDIMALDEHFDIYSNAIKTVLGSKGIPFSIDRFSKLEGSAIAKIPQFINTKLKSPFGLEGIYEEPTSGKQFTRRVKQVVKLLGIDADYKGTSECNRVLGNFMGMKESSSEVLISLAATYIATEVIFSDENILGKEGLFINAERHSPLLEVPEIRDILPPLKRVGFPCDCRVCSQFLEAACIPRWNVAAILSLSVTFPLSEGSFDSFAVKI